MSSWHSHGNQPQAEDELSAVYGDAEEVVRPTDADTSGKRKSAFAPWHHPVKQFVRREQWVAQVRRLLAQHNPRRLAYLTLPGEDMLDVRMLGELLKSENCQLDCLGFNSAGASNDDVGSQLNIQSALRQEGLITDKSITLADRIEEIARTSSQAHNVLSQWGTFDVINLDLCGHFSAQGDPSAFDAFNRIVEHQRSANRPWLLMLTTRVHPDQLNATKEHFNSAIQRNLDLNESFAEALSTALDVPAAELRAALPGIWRAADDRLIKLYAVGLGKYLLHLFHSQVQDPAHVELASCLAYRVHAEHPDMLSVVFRIDPQQKQLMPAGVLAVEIPPIEVARANQIAGKAGRLGDIDRILGNDAERLEAFTQESENLLRISNYDTTQFRQWAGEFRAGRAGPQIDEVGAEQLAHELGKDSA